MDIIKESPDTVVINGKTKRYFDQDAVCFSLTHGLCVYMEQNASKNGDPVTHDIIIAALLHLFDNKELALQDLDREGIKVIGSINDLNNKILQPLFGDKKNITFNRAISLRRAPNLVHGRLWYEKPKVISFWNNSTQVFQYRTEIIELVKKYGDPKEFIYNNLNIPRGYTATYQDFMMGNPITENKSVVNMRFNQWFRTLDRKENLWK